MHEGIDGEVILKDSPLDPIADIPSAASSTSTGRERGDRPDRRDRRRRSRADLAAAVRPPALRRPLGPREEGADAMRATATSIISADAHAGLPCEEYRPYLDPQYHERVRRLPRRAARRPRRAAEAELRLHHELGDRERRRPARRVRRRAARQGARRRRRGGRGDLPRRRRDHRHGSRRRSAPACRRARSTTPSSRSPARAPTTGSSSSCARRARAARRRRARADHPRRRRARSTEIEWLADAARHPRRDGPDDVARPPAVQRPDLRPGVGRVPGRRPPGAHALGRGAAGGVRTSNIGIYLAEVVWWTAPARSWHLLFCGAFERFPGPEVRRHRGGRATGPPT